jgi:type VI secretion system secreted protein Hcp
MIKKTVAMLVVLCITAITTQADAALMAYLYLKGQKTGDVKGSVTQKGREGSIAIIAMEQTSKYAVAPGGQQAKLNVGQLVVRKEIDKSSPVLRQMLDSGEIISMGSLKFWTPQLSAASGVGQEKQHYTINLANARITGIKTVMQNNRDPQLMKYEVAEEVTIAYDRADWIWIDGGITATETSGYAQP